MPPQIKQDLNRSGWETTDFPSVCERCLPENPYIQMIKEDHGAECKICSRPFTLFRFKSDRTSRQKRTNICLTCARLKNCCQCCMLDLSFGLPIVVRDAALKMVAPGPQSEINKQFYAQEHEKDIEEGRNIEGYEKTDEKARELLRRLANSEPYYKKQRREEAEEAGDGQKLLTAGGAELESRGPGPIRPREAKLAGAKALQKGKARVFPSTTQLPPNPRDIMPPPDPNVKSLFVTGVEDDLPEFELRAFFSKFGALRSVICSHRAHCAFMNFQTREGAEAAAQACQGRAVIAGCPLRVQWGKPKPLDSMETDERMANARAGRTAAGVGRGQRTVGAKSAGKRPAQDDLSDLVATAPPGAEDVEYASLAGN
ncbi:hypothetical protein EJ06DRAFT_513461 [Trichodelitschia bisporula]|uniref:RRM domain-containing protein n=1 Tax=Trichodelitschia bisporula TaxID=703511 RepID=A0A6G1HR10_9PEZI|nr:hypothetical protein EJ06DRAFT_513461 [Trichodelitschia bisporula]